MRFFCFVKALISVLIHEKGEEVEGRKTLWRELEKQVKACKVREFLGRIWGDCQNDIRNHSSCQNIFKEEVQDLKPEGQAVMQSIQPYKDLQDELAIQASITQSVM